MSSSNLHNPSTAPRAPTEATGWTGWIAFAALVMMISGLLSGISGFFAVVNHNWSTFNNDGVAYGSVYWWGWWTMFVGLVVFSIGAALLRGSMFARTVAVFVAAGSLISQFVTLNIAPRPTARKQPRARGMWKALVTSSSLRRPRSWASWAVKSGSPACCGCNPP